MLPQSRTARALVLCGVITLAVLVSAEPIKQLKPTGYVDDFAGVIDSQSRTAIEQLAAQVDHKANAQIAVVTIRSLDGKDIESFASDLYKQWGIGPKSSNRGVLILLAVQDRRYRAEVGYGLEPILPDGKVGGFGREAVPFLRHNQYGAELRLITQRVAHTIAADAHVTLEGAPAPTPVRNAGGEGVPGFLVVIFIFIALGIFFAAISAITRGGRGGGRGSGGSGIGSAILWAG